MSKMPIAWHKECAANAERSASERRTNLEHELARLVRDEANVRFRLEQIAEAERRGIVEYDAERFLVKRNGISYLTYQAGERYGATGGAA